jgi:DNA-directed RNA polymerase specialized sigma24 family protein
MELLKRCLAGDAQAWRQWVAETAPVIRHAVVQTLLRHTGRMRDEDADELTQDVYVRLVRDDCRLLRSYDPDRSRLGTWLTLVARSTTIDALRRRRLREASLDEMKLDPPAPPPAEARGPVVPPGLLTPRQELVLKLLFDEERDVGEVARLLSVDEQTVRSTKHKALTVLRRHFGVDRAGRGMSSE